MGRPPGAENARSDFRREQEEGRVRRSLDVALARLDSLKGAILKRDWGEVEFQFDCVCSIVVQTRELV